MNNQKVLATSWHPGGINAIIPVIKRLGTEKKVDLTVLGHEFSEPILAKAEIPFKTIRDFGLSDVSPESMQKILRATLPDLVLMGTASQEGKANDILEQSMIRASRKFGIKSLAVLDIWGNYWQRFTDERTGQRLGLNPDCIAIIDEIAREEMLKEGFYDEELVITGNPHFDNLPERARSFTEAQRVELRNKIGLTGDTLFFFAGNAFSSAESEFGYWDKDVLRVIQFKMHNHPNVGLAVRLHPRMPDNDKSVIADTIKDDFLGGNIKLIDDIDSQTLALVADVTFCEFSTIGIESVYMRRPTISLQPNLHKEDELLISRNGIIPAGYNWSTCLELVGNAVRPDYRVRLLEQSANFATDGKATERVVARVYKMIEWARSQEHLRQLNHPCMGDGPFGQR